MSRDRSQFKKIDEYVDSITGKDARETLRAVLYGFAGQKCSRNKAIAFIGGSKKFLDKMAQINPEMCLGKRENSRHSVTDYDVFEVVKLASIVHL